MNFDNAPTLKPKVPKIEKVTISDLQLEVPETGGTVLVLQRNAKDNRDLGNSQLEMGALIPEAAMQVRNHTRDSLNRVLSTLSIEERGKVDLLVVAADTELDTPLPGVKSKHKRAFETGEHVISGIKECLQSLSLPESQLLNKTGKPSELTSGRLRDLKMFEDSPDFVQFLIEKYGTGKEFWVAYENDTERETREKLKAEGPDDIAERIQNYLKILTNAMKFYHQSHPGRRLIVWVESHYDTISPFLKSRVAEMPKTDFLPVDNGAGVVIKLDKNQKATTKINGNSYDLSLAT